MILYFFVFFLFYIFLVFFFSLGGSSFVDDGKFTRNKQAEHF